jgi:hypothetical protein
LWHTSGTNKLGIRLIGTPGRRKHNLELLALRTKVSPTHTRVTKRNEGETEYVFWWSKEDKLTVQSNLMSASLLGRRSIS